MTPKVQMVLLLVILAATGSFWSFVFLYTLPDRRKRKAIQLAAQQLTSANPFDRDAAVTAFLTALRDSDVDIRSLAIGSLWRVGRETEIVVPLLVEAFRDEQFSIRDHAARALGNIGPHGQAAIPALREALSHSHGPHRQAVAAALLWIGADRETAIQVLVESVQSGVACDRTSAMETTWGLGARQSHCFNSGSGSRRPGK